jgi:hypothetical protein
MNSVNTDNLVRLKQYHSRAITSGFMERENNAITIVISERSEANKDFIFIYEYTYTDEGNFVQLVTSLINEEGTILLSKSNNFDNSDVSELTCIS